MGQQSHFEFNKMKCFVVLALALATAKPGYMRIPGWQKIQSGMKKLNQKEPTGTYIPRPEHTPKRPVVSLMPTLRRLSVVLKPLPMNSHGKSDYSSMDTSVADPSFLKNTS